ncbi:DNA-binding protein [Ureaplasma diversum]|uniref:DNA-binding protein n=1 Tax=Ureaplasma diversum TaxID=42094 RepID=A0A0C5RQ14_9BACT|nr:HU family DNA-binding protein [Ureaplasma diversum]AJQ45474.1 DNA-binding protein [Ureaplasma diversum]
MENNNKPKTRSQLVDVLSKMIGQDKKTTKHFMETYEALLVYELSKAKEVRLGSIGKFKVTERAERKAINPATNEHIIIPAKNIPKFAFAKGIKEIVNAGIIVDDGQVMLENEEEDFDGEDEFVDEYIPSKDEELN